MCRRTRLDLCDGRAGRIPLPHRRLGSATMPDEHPPEAEVIITVPADMQAGVWANWAAINESDHAFRE